jgi:effector-binding domain-containing protein
MIVRISGEAQYRLADEQARQLNELEGEVVAIVEGGREDGFAQAYARLLGYVREHGERLPDEELAGSDVILPPADISFQEAGREFTGEGLIPD